MRWKTALTWVGTIILFSAVGVGGLRLITWINGQDTRGAALIAGPEVFQWAHDDPNFGGLSGLLIEDDMVLVASDKGTLFQAQIDRDPAGDISGLQTIDAVSVPTSQGRPTTEFKGDLEGLARLDDGRLMLAFESYTRIETLDALDDIPRPTHRWDRFQGAFGNQAFEGIATLPDGRVLAIREGYASQPATLAYLYDGDSWSDGFTMPLSDGFVVVGADVGPDGCLYLLDRRYTLAGGFAHRLRRLRRLNEQGELIYQSAPARLGNAEGISVNEIQSDVLRVTLVTDDGFWPLTPTRLIEYDVEPALSCDGQF